MDEYEKKLVKGMIVCVILMSVSFYLMFSSLSSIENHISKNGLKNYIERIWEGERK